MDIRYLKNMGKLFYPLTHTKAVYDNDGTMLEDRLSQMNSDFKAYTDTKVANLVGSAPETLDTIEEVANAIKDNDTVVQALNCVNLMYCTKGGI